MGAATLQVVQAVRSNTPVRPLLAAVSGGADSLALAFAVAKVCAERDRPCSAVTVDHGLQPDSASRADRVVDQLRDIGLTDVGVIKVSVTGGSGPEADARAARYAVLDAAASARDAELVLGHTLDDQAETVLLGLVRGSGPRSLAGMTSSPGRCRPLLGIRREQTRTACAELGLEHWDDPHNADPRFTRSRIRQRVLPTLETELGPGIAEALARSAELIRADADLLDRLAADLLEVVRRDGDLDCAILASAEPALRTRVIRQWLIESGADEAPYERVSAVQKLITDWHGQAEVQLPGLGVRRVAGRLVATAAGR